MTPQNNRNCSRAFSTTDIANRAVRNVFELLSEGEAKLCNQRAVKDIVLVLGNTGAGKSVFTRTIAGYDTTLKSVDEDLHYAIKNPYDENGGKSFVTSSTIFPDQVRDNNTGIVYYDFPGFQDTRGMAHDITTTYFIKKIVDSAVRVKLLLLVNYTSLTTTGTRDDFTTLLSHIIKFVGDVEKYQGGIALIATKVELHSKSDDQIISVIAKFIETVKQNLEQQVDNPKALNMIKLLNILLKQDGNMYSKIAIFRSPNQAGYLSHIPKLQENIAYLKTKLANLKFVEKTNEDFGYTIPKQSLIDVDKIIKEIARSFTTTVQDMGKEIQRYLSAEQDQLHDISKLYNLTSVRYDELKKIKERANNQEEFEKCTLEIVNGAASMNINLSIHQDMLKKLVSYSSFLHEVSDHEVQNQFKCADGMQDVIEDSHWSKKWYLFLNKLYERLSDYEIQKNTRQNPCTALAENVVKAIENEKNSQFNLDPLSLKKCYPDYESMFENRQNVTVDKSKLIYLKTVLNLGLQNILSYSCDSNKLVIKGTYVKLGDVPDIQNRECKVRPKFIEIFASNKVFIDSDLDKTGEEVQLSVIAPAWYIQGSRTIRLDGKPGEPHYSEKARDGVKRGDSGKDGLPGLPGGPAGNFIGIGETFKNLQELTVSVRGGDGGPGQNGGNGKYGQDGKNAYNDIHLEKDTLDKITSMTWLNSIGTIVSDHHTILKASATIIGYDVILAGQPGGEGGSGGHGGMGGLGGNLGEIIFSSLSSSDTNHINKVIGIGKEGVHGRGGFGAVGGKHGNNMKVSMPAIFSIVRQTETTEIYIMEHAAYGYNGINGYNDFHRKHPKQSEKILNPGVLINAYKNYIRETTNQSVSEFYSSAFLQKLESIPNMLHRRRRRRYADSTNETFNVDHDEGSNFKNSNLSSNITPENRTENSIILNDPDLNQISSVANDSNFAKSTGVRINSPINFAINFFSNFFSQLEFFTPTNIMTLGLVKGGIEYMFGESTSSNIHSMAESNTNHSLALALGSFNINESLTLIDFAIRCITKQKFYHSVAKAIGFSEIKAFVLSIVTEFEEILSDMSVKYNLPLGSLEFDPVTLMSELEKEMINQNYEKVVPVLYRSIEGNSHLDSSQFRTHILRDLEKAMEMQKNKIISRNTVK
ncbi:uncharacterized protein LOC135837483 [Planococcus citri]|uniref:uncharacterized protein LOC135837483 n=1 Tax=Planococcus citri TaxID=170843 RepID=UPI0031F74120